MQSKTKSLRQELTYIAWNGYRNNISRSRQSESGVDYEERFRQGNAEILNSKVHSGGYGQCAKNAALDSITGGLFSVGGMVSENTKKCEKLVDATAKELSEMNL